MKYHSGYHFWQRELNIWNQKSRKCMFNFNILGRLVNSITELMLELTLILMDNFH